MVRIDNYLISSELFEVEFACHLEKCLGNCCVHGDAGAPLTDGEAELLEKLYGKICDYVSEPGKDAINEQGMWVFDSDGEKVTPLVSGKECAYTIFREGIAFCAIEKAWEEGNSPFRKPVSCHLYPIRLSRVGEYTALNYHRWGICEPARILGKKLDQPVFRFLREPLTRVFGENLYDKMELVYKELNPKLNQGKF